MPGGPGYAENLKAAISVVGAGDAAAPSPSKLPSAKKLLFLTAKRRKQV
jgi:hypothetical protein